MGPTAGGRGQNLFTASIEKGSTDWPSGGTTKWGKLISATIGGCMTHLPPLPDRDDRGNRPAARTAQVLMARQLIRARLARNLSRKELAAMANVSVETLARIESGQQMPRPRTIEKITRALGEV